MNTIHTQANSAKDEHCTTTTITNASSQMILKSPFSIELVTDDEKLVHFYTGFEDYDTLMISYIFWDHLHRGHLQYWMKWRYVEWVKGQETCREPCLLSPENELYVGYA